MPEVTALSPGDIQRGGGVSAGGEPRAFRQDDGNQAAQSTEMTPEQQSAVGHIDALRRQASDPALGRAEREQVMQKISQLQRHTFMGEAAPAWYGEHKPDPKLTDMRPVSDSDLGMEKHFVPIVEGDMAALVTRAVIVGQVGRGMATEAAQFCRGAQLPKVVSEAIVDRLAKHVSEGWGPGSELSDADRADLASECIRAFGSEEKALAESTLARKYLHSVGGDALLANVDKRAGSLGYDPRVILQLSMMARARGLK